MKRESSFMGAKIAIATGIAALLLMEARGISAQTQYDPCQYLRGDISRSRDEGKDLLKEAQKLAGAANPPSRLVLAACMYESLGMMQERDTLMERYQAWGEGVRKDFDERFISRSRSQ